MNLPAQVKAFIDKGITFVNYCLPHFYPKPNGLDDFQIGYKVDGVSGNDITGALPGDFKASWYVICSTYAADPFFIDIKEEDKNFPIYFAWHGAGTWTPISVSESIIDFARQLEFLKKQEAKDENMQKIVKENFDLNNEFWKEVYNSYEQEEFTSDYQPPTAKEKRVIEINLELKDLKVRKEKGELLLKDYLITKRKLEDELKSLWSNTK